MKILLVHPHDIFSVSEPWTVRITEIAQELAARGHQVKLVYFPLPPKERGELRCKEFRGFETIPFKRRKWAIFGNIYKMTKLARWADIIHFQKCFAIASIPSLFAAYLTGKPIHYDWDDWEYKIYLESEPSKVYGFYLNRVERSIPRMVDSISVSSEHLKKMAITWGASPEKIVKAPVGANLKLFNPSKKGGALLKKYNVQGPFIVYVGQLHGAQYVELFLRAARILEKEAVFVVVGGGSDLQRLKNKAKEINAEVIFTGFLNNEEVSKIMAEATVAVACFEDREVVKCKSPLKIVEYLASGKAIVASDVGEVGEMVNGCGVLTKPGDAESLAKGIRELLKNDKLRKEYEIKARKRAEEVYNWSSTVDNLVKAYEMDLK